MPPLARRWHTFVMITAIFMVFAMWIFPEAVAKRAGELAAGSRPSRFRKKAAPSTRGRPVAVPALGPVRPTAAGVAIRRTMLPAIRIRAC
jgi:hypothetical protein